MSTRLWKNTVTGEIFILNQYQDRLPLQRAWCGIAGNAWRTRADIALPIRRSPTVAAIAPRPVPKVERRAVRDNVTCRTAARRIDQVKCHIAATHVDQVKCHTATTRVDQLMCRIAAMHATYA
ncbi:hypothetical protein [Candidatus Sodalis pierantonius]|uniref:hypothetical protein n=1 Tax=Candidatus Sodalis pierantonii TaxID=1486991 RepID=UPI0011DCD73F|nr:hypothetical protein [Candidatus Sodalis pierantonius]